MKGKAHASIGMLTYYNYTFITQTPLGPIELLSSLFFSILPDLDHYDSIISHAFTNKKLENIIENVVLITGLLIVLIAGYIKKLDYYLLFSLIMGSFIVIKSKIKNSFIRKCIITAFIMTFSLAFYFIFKIKSIFFIFAFISAIPWTKHRSASHSLIACVLVYLFMLSVESVSNIDNLAVISSISYSSHILLGDILTPSGVPLLWPLSNRRFSLVKNIKHSKKYVAFMEKTITGILILSGLYLTLISGII